MLPYTVVDQVAGPGGRWLAPGPPPPAPASPTPTSDVPSLFTAFRRSYPQRSVHDSFVWIEVHSHALLRSLKAVFPSLASLYDSSPGIDARAVWVQRGKLRASAAEASRATLLELSASARGHDSLDPVTVLLGFLDDLFAPDFRILATYPPGHASWHLLWTFFELGMEVEAHHDVTGEPIALVLDEWEYAQEAMGRSFIVRCHGYQWTGVSYHRVHVTRRIAEFQDLRSVSTLPVLPLCDESRSLLQERGQRYLSYVTRPHADYEGVFCTRAFSGASRLLGNGQVILDVKSFRRCNPALDTWSDDESSKTSQSFATPRSSAARASVPCAPVTAEQAHLLPPSIHGYSLRAKRWGEFLVDRLTPIVWREHSFEHLVIPSSYRRVVKALVSVHSGELKGRLVTDVIADKGNGLVMALHGAPGTGKTLTAEAVAEHLRRPLYAVSAGELGHNASSLEQQLRVILELATAWQAVLLIDEADIFLAKRDPLHLERNALVGIFLRMLEYFSGVLILTTNRIEEFDEAFMSRFAIVLRFDELDKAARQTLWQRFLRKVAPRLDLGAFDLARLASHPLNGREIKHALQSAQALALIDEQVLSMEHIDEVLSIRRT
ncbi:uncharacterized protein RHOBADRAFT_53721 [Rhodotorula graminis WP1]|uniref:AAA+ ATPase domain-containing protein n=1 Tax=Rhodotorula graminis (strain WP1) TaxID=578459 RepID=A0A194S2F8_RHOGW|nr:uncharacterized protein RHOBADRAFT_53721 [Rhodotorula graminis WP1]KPV74782.1 hypothetical protein RHOBADRAFT_53721 [Rhodotorula graminis WP1]